MFHQLLADIVVVVHAAYVGFVTLGLAAILLGIALRWRWVRNFWFRMIHLAAIGVVCLEAFAGIVCPLTTLENYLREQGGMATYEGDFIGRWAGELIFFAWPPWVFTTIYLTFGLVVAAVFVLAPPLRPGKKPTPSMLGKKYSP